MNPTKSPAVQRIESLLFASYCAFLGATSPAVAREKLQEWDQLSVTTVQTTKSHEEILAVLQGTRSGSETEFIIFGRLLDTATTLERFAFIYNRVAEKLNFAETRLLIFSDNPMKVRAAKLKTLMEQVFEKWDTAALKKLGNEASHEHCQLIGRQCPRGGKTSEAISSRLAAIATEELRLAEKEKKDGAGGTTEIAEAV